VTPTDWALAMEARVRALLAEGDTADGHNRDSIAHLRQTRVRVELARGHLLHGEWLRRERRRADARAQLRTAFELLSSMGAVDFADRARRELQATGETVRKRTVPTHGELTPQEAQIARLARDRVSNPEIGARLPVIGGQFQPVATGGSSGGWGGHEVCWSPDVRWSVTPTVGVRGCFVRQRPGGRGAAGHVLVAPRL
jgi:hypothetical protein